MPIQRTVLCYQGAVILTHEDCQSRLLARRSGSGDVVHRCDAPTLSSGRDRQPEGLFLAALGQRRLLVTMNHIATSQPPARNRPQGSGSPNLGINTGSPSARSEEHTSELQSLMRNSYDVFCWKKTTN